jgi:hypothetical protein
MSPLIISVAVIVTGAWLAARWWARRSKQTVDCSHRLLKELCSKHRLGPRQRRLIAQLASELQLDQPAMIFVDPRLWELDEASPVRQSWGNAVAALRDCLFDNRASAAGSR